MPALYIGGFFGIVIGLNLLLWLVLPRLSPLRRSGYRAEVRPPAGDTQHHFEENRSWHGRGGVRVGRMNATYPLARLDIDASCAKIRSPFGSIAIDRSDVTGVRIIGMISPGVHFDSADGRFDGLIFWTFSSADVLAQFRWFGWAVPAPRGSAVVGAPAGSNASMPYPWLPPPPPAAARPVPPPRPPPPPPARESAPRPPPPATVTPSTPGYQAIPAASPIPKSASHGATRRSLVAICRYVGHYLSAAAVAICLAALGASLVPALRGHVDLGSLAPALIPVALVLFALAVLSLHETPRAHRPYRASGRFPAFLLPEAWPRRLLLIGVIVVAVVSIGFAAAGPWSSPRRVDGTYAVERNGVTEEADAAKYEQVRATEDRPGLAIVLIFFTVAYTILAEVDIRDRSESDHAHGRTGRGPP